MRLHIQFSAFRTTHSVKHTFVMIKFDLIVEAPFETNLKNLICEFYNLIAILVFDSKFKFKFDP